MERRLCESISTWIWLEPPILLQCWWAFFEVMVIYNQLDGTAAWSSLLIFLGFANCSLNAGKRASFTPLSITCFIWYDVYSTISSVQVFKDQKETAHCLIQSNHLSWCSANLLPCNCKCAVKGRSWFPNWARQCEYGLGDMFRPNKSKGKHNLSCQGHCRRH